MALLGAKNLAGAVLVLAGLAMLVLPGQGLLTIVVGLLFLDFPGKRSLELRLVRHPPVLRTINWLRATAHRPPLQMPDEKPRMGNDRSGKRGG